VADQRFESLPIAGRMPAGAFDQAEEPRGAPGVQPYERPPGAGVLQLDVVGAHQLYGCDIDQPMAQHIGPQQHLTFAALETAKINLVLGQHNSIRRELVNGLAADEHIPPSDSGHDPGHQRILVGATQPHDHVLDPADVLAGAGHHRCAQQLREMDYRKPAAGLGRLVF